MGLGEKIFTLDLYNGILKIHQGPGKKMVEKKPGQKFGKIRLEMLFVAATEIEVGMLENVKIGIRHRGI